MEETGITNSGTYQYEIELRNIVKHFPGVRALDNVSIGVRKGTVHAIVGENGAGKSTLMKVLSGLYTPDSGEISLRGEPVQFHNINDSREKGIAMIYQELNYFPELSIEENIFMGRFIGKGFVRWKDVRKQATELLARENITYSPKTLIKNLSVSDIQMLEIIKAVSFNANVVIMDEPTSSITNREVDRLFAKIEEMKKTGICVLYISHKMDEIFRIADDVTVMRDGKVVSSDPINNYTGDVLISQMVGRQITNVYPKETVPFGEVCLEVKDLCSDGVFADVSLSVRKGEIVGIAGLVGAGRTELSSAVAGFDPITSGDIILGGEKITITSINDAIKKGIIMVSEDRRKYGIIGCRNILENVTLAHHGISEGWRAGTREQIDKAKGIMTNLAVKAASYKMNVENLSGGNQQKVVLSKWLMLDTKVMIMDEPTRGIDVGAKYEIYKIMCNLARNGTGILMISSEIPELMGMADRIYVMCKGRFVAELPREKFSQETIMQYAIGVTGKDERTL